ncbi:MAG: YgcG family protein [Xanthomonadales bacterium]|nr:YgcG family protein [Xanthomonadales bacterium]
MNAALPRWWAWVICLTVCLGTQCALAYVPVPTLVTHVTDTTATLSEQQKSELEQKLRALEQRKGAQLLILIVPSTQPEEIEQYATRVFDTWKIGRKNVDDGALLLWAKNDRRIRIEVGRGLEGPIPDVLASRIINDTMRPLFRNEAWFEGLDKATDQLTGLIDGEALPDAPASIPESATAETPESIDRYFPIFFFIPIVVVITAIWPRRREVSASVVASVITTATAFKALDLPLGSLPWVALIYFLFGLAYAFDLFPKVSSSGGSSGGWSGGSGGSSWGGGGGSSAGGGASGSY